MPTRAAFSELNALRPRVMLVSHAYSEHEMRKAIYAYAPHVEMRVVCPARADVLVFKDLQFEHDERSRGTFLPLRAIRLFGAQFILLSRSMGMASYQPDIVHVEYEPWSVMFWQAYLSRSVYARRAKLICGVKKNTYRRYRGVRGALKTILGRIGIARVDHFIAASKRASRLFIEELAVDPRKVTVATHLGVDTSRFKPAHPRPRREEFVVGYCGRLDSHKGVTDLVAAVDHLRTAHDVDIRLELIGDGGLMPMLRERASEYPWLTLHGRMINRDVAQALQRLDLFVLLSRVLPDHEEHDAHSMLQAFATGLPTIGAASGIIPELLSDGRGILIESESPCEAEEAILQLRNDGHLRERLGATARRSAVSLFSNEAVAAAKARIYEGVLSVP